MEGKTSLTQALQGKSIISLPKLIGLKQIRTRQRNGSGWRDRSEVWPCTVMATLVCNKRWQKIAGKKPGDGHCFLVGDRVNCDEQVREIPNIRKRETVGFG